MFFYFQSQPRQSAGLVFIADNGCCDYYAFRIESGKCREEIVFFDHEDHTIKDTAFSDVLEYLIKTGLHQSNIL